MKEIFSLFSSRDAVVLILSGSHGNQEGRKNFCNKKMFEVSIRKGTNIQMTASEIYGSIFISGDSALTDLEQGRVHYFNDSI